MSWIRARPTLRQDEFDLLLNWLNGLPGTYCKDFLENPTGIGESWIVDCRAHHKDPELSIQRILSRNHLRCIFITIWIEPSLCLGGLDEYWDWTQEGKTQSAYAKTAIKPFVCCFWCLLRGKNEFYLMTGHQVKHEVLKNFIIDLKLIITPI